MGIQDIDGCPYSFAFQENIDDCCACQLVSFSTYFLTYLLMSELSGGFPVNLDKTLSLPGNGDGSKQTFENFQSQRHTSMPALIVRDVVLGT